MCHYFQIEISRCVIISRLRSLKVSKSQLGNIDTSELAFYIAKFSPKHLLKNEGLTDYIFMKKRRKNVKKTARKHNRGKEKEKKKKKDEKENWVKPKKVPTKEIARKLFGIAIQTLILTCLKSHVY